MVVGIVIVYIVTIISGLATIIVAFSLARQYRLPFLNSYAYFLLFFIIAVFINIFGTRLIYILLREVSLQTKNIQIKLIAPLLFPLSIMSLYFFIKMVLQWLGKPFFIFYKIGFMGFWGVVLLGHFFGILFDVKLEDVNVLVIAAWLTDTGLIIAYYGNLLYLILKSKDGRDAGLQKIGRIFGIIYLISFISLDILYIRYLGDFLGKFEFPVRSLWYFLIHAPPLFYLRGSLKAYSISFTDSTDEISSLDEIFLNYSISKREKEIITLILDGKTNREIEDALFISLKTVKNHVYRIYRKMGVNNRVQLINLVMKAARSDEPA